MIPRRVCLARINNNEISIYILVLINLSIMSSHNNDGRAVSLDEVLRT